MSAACFLREKGLANKNKEFNGIREFKNVTDKIVGITESPCDR